MIGARVMQWPRQAPSRAKRIVQLSAYEGIALIMIVRATRHQHRSIREQSCCMELPSIRQVAGLVPEAICDIVKHGQMRNLASGEVFSSGDEYLTILQQSRCMTVDQPGQRAGEAPGSNVRIVEFCSVVASSASSADDQHLAIRQKSRRVTIPRNTHITGLAPSAGCRVVKFCALQDALREVISETSGYQNPPVTKQSRCMVLTSPMEVSSRRPFAGIWIVQF